MKVYTLLLAITLTQAVSAQAQNPVTPEDKEAAYIRTINTRAEKIVTTLGITDAAKAERVKNIIAAQYKNLNTIHSARDEKVKALKGSGGEKAAIEVGVKKIEEAATADLQKLHKKYVQQLSSQLSEQQVAQVKDGMTFGVVNVTYKGYVDMIPSLTAAQKKQIMDWLVEAREYAMDAESSEKKHWWFGKYKGRINNYLSAAGYDIQKERKEWEKRLAAAKAAGQ